jgi:ferredoxin
MFLLALAIILDGFLGAQVSPINLAGILPWTYWRGFAIIALLVAGNVFCAVCPFTVPRTLASRFMTAHRRWPRALRSKWLAIGLFATYLWAYEALRLWDRPSWTAWIVIGYFTTAFLIDSIFEGASFCKYVCPIGQFHFVNSFVSPLEVTVRKPQVCTACATHDCLHSCGLQLLQPEKRGNFDCTFCLKCIPACPTQNVAILPASPARRFTENRKLFQRRDVLALALVIVFGAFANAAGMTAPVMSWMHSWHAKLGISSMLSLHAIYYAVALIALPAIAWAVCRRNFILTLIPIGFAMWLAHFVFHLATGWTGLPTFQFLALDAGLLFALYLIWRIAARWSEALGPVAFAIALYAAGFWIVLQPMERMA